MAQSGCPAGALLNFAQGQMFDENQFQKMSIRDKIRIRIWIGKAIIILTLIALYEEICELCQSVKNARNKK